MKYVLFFLLFLGGCVSFAQTNRYEISFENAVHHEAKIKGVFSGLDADPVSFRMSRTSPGRYALHEFAKEHLRFQGDRWRWQILVRYPTEPVSMGCIRT